jgi:hypothetical protein
LENEYHRWQKDEASKYDVDEYLIVCHIILVLTGLIVKAYIHPNDDYDFTESIHIVDLA